MKRFAFILCFFLALADSSFAALSAATIWEARSATGNDTNGGGWVAGASGTDWTQQAAAQYAVSDAVTAGTTTITSATANFGTDVVGNILYITGGTGAIAADWYQITARASSVSITVDRSTGLTTGTGATLNIGGALGPLAITTLSTKMVAGNKAYCKGTTFTSTSTSTFAQTVTPSGATAATRLIGYTTTRGDNGQFLLTLQTNTGLTGLKSTGGGFHFENCAVDCASLGTSTGIDLGGNYSRVVKCKVSNFTTRGMLFAGALQQVCWENEVTLGTSAATAAIDFAAAVGSVTGNFVHDNACTGIIQSGTSGAFVSFNLVTNNTGATSDGIRLVYTCIATFNTCHGNGRDGLRNTQAYNISSRWLNNILTSNAGYGITGNSSTAGPAESNYDGNVFWNNTTGTRNLMDNVTGIFAVNPYVNSRDVTLSGSPYTNAAGNDFSLNNTAGAGASCRGAAVPGLFVGSSSTSVGDMGAVQAAAAAASGTSHTFLQ